MTGHVEHLKAVYNLRGKSVVDVGAGDGTFSRQLGDAGATVSAVEIDPVKVSKVKANLPNNINMLSGRAEKLPIEDHSQDLACFFFSLHHVPVDVQNTAFDEVVRILKSHGRLHIVEPYPYGSMFEVVRMVDDETAVRTHSHKILSKMGREGRFRLVARNEYTLTRKYSDFDAFVDKIVRQDPERSRVFSGIADAMKDTFHSAIENVDGVSVLHQPCAAYHFKIIN